MINGIHYTVTLEYIKYNICKIHYIAVSLEVAVLWKEFQYKMSASGEEVKLELTIMACYFLTTSL